MQINIRKRGQFCPRFVIALASASAFAATLFEVRMRVRAAKFGYRKCHGFKDTAGIVVGGRYAFLVGYNILGRAYYVLTWTYYSYNREYAYRNREIAPVVVIVGKISIQRGCYRFGYIAAATARAAAMLILKNVNAKHNGLNRLYNCYLIGMF